MIFINRINCVSVNVLLWSRASHIVPVRQLWVFIKGGCSRSGVQWIGVVSYNKKNYDIM